MILDFSDALEAWSERSSFPMRFSEGMRREVILENCEQECWNSFKEHFYSDIPSAARPVRAVPRYLEINVRVIYSHAPADHHIYSDTLEGFIYLLYKPPYCIAL